MMNPALHLFSQLGVLLPGEVNGAGQVKTTCPFCFREDHFYISNSSNPLFICHRCGVKGNRYGFLKLIYEACLGESRDEDYLRLSSLRKGAPPEAFQKARLAYHRQEDKWLIPIYNQRGTLVNLRMFQGGKLHGCAGISTKTYGVERITPDTENILLCEGEWDAILANYYLEKWGLTGWVALGVPGASQSVPLDSLSGKVVWIAYDHDEAGRKGSEKASEQCRAVASQVKVLAWPEGRFQEGYDLSDYLTSASPSQEEFFSWFREHASATVFSHKSFEDVLKVFEDTGVYLHEDFRTALVLALSVVDGTQLAGEPLWLFLVGVPGSGKSLILESLLGGVDWCLYRTSISYRSFLSGHKSDQEDTSLLSVLPGKTLVVKDYSNVLSLPHQDQALLFSLLREAYDGKVVRNYGNMVSRVYPPEGSGREDCRFNLLAGVTPELFRFSHASLGERFLRFRLHRSEEDDLLALKRVLSGDSLLLEGEVLRKEVVRSFLGSLRREGGEPECSDEYREQLCCLARMVSYCRSHVSRTGSDLDYQPELESATRVARQLHKLSLSVARVLGKDSCHDAEVIKVVRRVAWDTCYGRRGMILRELLREGCPVNVSFLADKLGLSYASTRRELMNLLDLNLVSSEQSTDGKKGRPSSLYQLLPKTRDVLTRGGGEELPC